MGGICSRPQFNNKMKIQGNHNLAFMLNGVHYNITNIIDEMIHEIVKNSRLNMIKIHSASVLLILFLIMLFLYWFIPSRQVIRSEINKIALEFLNISQLFF